MIFSKRQLKECMKLAGRIVSPDLYMYICSDISVVFLYTGQFKIEYIKYFKCYHFHIRTVMMNKMVIIFQNKIELHIYPRKHFFKESIIQMGTIKYWEH